MASNQSSSCSVKLAGVCGISYHWKEILDLLAFWGDAKVEQILKSNCQNIDCFEEIANQLAAKGHLHSAKKYRSKAKATWLQYKQAMCYNYRSGEGRVQCAFLAELHNILKGDTNMAPMTIEHSLNVKHKYSQPHVPAAGSEMFSNSFICN